MLVEKVFRTIEKYNLINHGDLVVLGLSGGPDSVCLIHVLDQLRERIGFELVGVHVNHMLRAETADRDQKFAEELCDSLHAKFRAYKIDCKTIAQERHISTEEAGRLARYGAFSEAAEELVARDATGAPTQQVKIAVAHNADDQAETLLFRLLRGTGTDGLAGMEHMRSEKDAWIIRPLLDVTRAEIEEHLRSEDIEYVTDETNEQPIYTRNKIRLEMLPYIKEHFNANIVAALTRLSDIASADKDYIWEQAEHVYQKCVISASDGHVVLDRSVVGGLHEAIRHRVIMRALREVGLWEDVTHERLLAIDEMFDGDNATKVIELPHGYKITFAYGDIRVKAPTENSTPDIHSIQVELVDNPGEVNKLRGEINTRGYSGGMLCMDADKVVNVSGVEYTRLVDETCIRSRLEGDLIPLRSGTKKLKKLLGEMKIPADERDAARVIAVGKCVLSVSSVDGLKVRYADSLRIEDKTKAILIVKIV